MNTHSITAVEARRLLDEDRRRLSRAHELRRAQKWFASTSLSSIYEAEIRALPLGYNQINTPFGNYTLSELLATCTCPTCELAKVLT